MGLKETIQAAVQSGLKGLGNLQPNLTYQAAGTPSYNATTGASSVTTTSYTVPGTFAAYRKDEIDGQVIRPEDQKCLIGALALPVTPTVNDQIVNGTETWLVVGVRIDPAGALWVLQVRRP